MTGHKAITLYELIESITKIFHPCECNHEHNCPIDPYGFYLETYRFSSRPFTPHDPDYELKLALGKWVNWRSLQYTMQNVPVNHITNVPCEKCKKNREDQRKLVIDNLYRFQKTHNARYFRFNNTSEKLLKNSKLYEPPYQHLYIHQADYIEFCKTLEVDVVFSAKYKRDYAVFDPLSDKPKTRMMKNFINEFFFFIKVRQINKGTLYINSEKFKNYLEQSNLQSRSKFTIKSAVYLFDCTGEWPSPKTVYEFMLYVIHTYRTNHVNFKIDFSDFYAEIEDISVDDCTEEDIYIFDSKPITDDKPKKGKRYSQKGCEICLSRFELENLHSILDSKTINTNIFHYHRSIIEYS